MSEFEMQKNAGDYPLTSRKIQSDVIYKEVGADFVLPDYMGDIKRMLKYTASAVPCNKLVSVDEASFLCIVTFRVTYLDSDDMLTEAVFSADCEVSEKLYSNVIDADVNYNVQTVSVRLGGPRKISARATVGCNVYAIEECEICDRAEYDGAEMLKKEVEIRTAEYLKCSEREYAEQIERIEEISADELEVVKSFGIAFIDAVHKTEGGVNLSGYADALCILRSDEELIRLEKRIPIEEHIECELHDGGVFIPKAYVTGVNVNLNNVNTDDACAVSVVMNMTVECGVAQHYNEKLSVVSDAFYEGCKNDCTYQNFEFSRLGDCIYDKASFSACIDRGEEPLYDVIDREMVIKNLRYENTGTDITVLCDAELHMVARGNGADDCYPIKEKFEFSKKYRLQASENTKIELNAIPCDVSISLDSEKIYVEAQILVSVLTEIKETERILANIECERVEGCTDRAIVVYYPEKDDTLWSVSKKYAVSPMSIVQKNPNCQLGEDYNLNVFEMGHIVVAK